MGISLAQNLANARVSNIDDFVAFHVGAILHKARSDAMAELGPGSSPSGRESADDAKASEGDILVVLNQMRFTDEPGSLYS